MHGLREGEGRGGEEGEEGGDTYAVLASMMLSDHPGAALVELDEGLPPGLTRQHDLPEWQSQPADNISMGVGTSLGRVAAPLAGGAVWETSVQRHNASQTHDEQLALQSRWLDGSSISSATSAELNTSFSGGERKGEKEEVGTGSPAGLPPPLSPHITDVTRHCLA